MIEIRIGKTALLLIALLFGLTLFTQARPGSKVPRARSRQQAAANDEAERIIHAYDREATANVRSVMEATDA